MDPKPGYTTTEFWTTILTHVFAAFLSVYTVVFHKSFLNDETLNALIPVAALLASAIAQAFYNHSRAVVKSAALMSRPLASISDQVAD